MRSARQSPNRSRRGAPRQTIATVLAADALAACSAGVASGASGGTGPLSSVQVQTGLCQTTGGGAFVAIPGFPGESIDARLLDDIAWMVRRYKIFITDGYATSGHAPNGEHPIGLALDIVPNKAAGGNWRKINKLARWAEPKQNDPRAPFRWVGYNGDSGHGRGNHLHLSWMHSETRPKVPAEVVYTRFCPGGSPTGPTPPDPARERILDDLPFAGPNYEEHVPAGD